MSPKRNLSYPSPDPRGNILFTTIIDDIEWDVVELPPQFVPDWESKLRNRMNNGQPRPKPPASGLGSS